MSKYLSKFFTLFSIIFIIGVFFIESNIGFKWMFYLTNYFFLGVQTEEISGNWRNFTLKKISYNTSNTSIQVDSIHVILDVTSLFKKCTIIKDIKTKNVVIVLKDNNNNDLKKIESHTFFRINKYIKNSIIFNKIHADKILLQTSQVDLFLSNVLTSISVFNNNITIFPTSIDNIRISLLNHLHINHNTKKQHLIKINNILNNKNIRHMLFHMQNEKKMFIPFNINLLEFKCHQLSFIDYKNSDFFNIKLIAKVANNVCKITKLTAHSIFFNIKSYGKIIFSTNNFFSCMIHNKILLPGIHSHVINILFESNLYKTFKCTLEWNNVYKINIDGKFFFSYFNDTFKFNLTSTKLSFYIKKDCIFKVKENNLMLRGNVNHYSLLIENIINLHSMPTMSMKIIGEGNLQHIALKKIELFLMQNKCYQTTKKNFQYDPYVFALIGKTDVLGVFNNNTSDIFLSNINLNSNIINKKISVLGSLHYKNFKYLTLPGITLLLGKNKIFVNGQLSKNFYMNSSIEANHLDYFFPHLQGKINSKANIHGGDNSPVMITNTIFGEDIHINNVYLEAFQFFLDLNVQEKLLGTLLFNVKKMYFGNFHIHSLQLKTNWKYDRQRFSLLFKSNVISLHLNANGVYDDKKSKWSGTLQNISIQTIFGNFCIENSQILIKNNIKIIKNKNFKKIVRYKNILTLCLYEKQKLLSNIFNKSFMRFKKKLSINTTFKWMFRPNMHHGKFFFTANSVMLKKTIKNNLYSRETDFVNFFMNIKKDDLQSQWILKKIINAKEETNISGYLNIKDIYKKQNIEGQCFMFNFPLSIINFFTQSFNQATGKIKSNIVFSGTLYSPKISANIYLKDIVINSDNILQYITFIFPYLSGKIDIIKINQSIIINKADMLFSLDTVLKEYNNVEWNLLFKSDQMAIFILPKIKIKFSSHLNLHYLLSKYDLVGYIRCALFSLKINEKNFVI